MNKDIKEALIEIVGQQNFTDLLIDLVSYAYDASGHDHRPDAAVWPTDAEHVSLILDMADKECIPVIPRGAGTGLAGAAVPVRGGLVLDMCRMNRIIDIRISDRLALLQPGVVYADLQKALAPYGFFFPPDPRQRQGMHSWRQRGYKCRGDQGCKIWGDKGLCPGAGGCPPRGPGHADRIIVHEVGLGL